MARNDTTSAIIDGILKLSSLGLVSVAILVAPNALRAIDKPLAKLLDGFDKRERERELRRVIKYMNNRGLINNAPDAYEHGIVLTAEGKARLKKLELNEMAISIPEFWDKKWRLVFFDIPESKRRERNALTYKFRLLGLQQLQKSIWVHPFPCRSEIEAVAESLGVRHYITYVEISQIDNHSKLIKRFSALLNQ